MGAQEPWLGNLETGQEGLSPVQGGLGSVQGGLISVQGGLGPVQGGFGPVQGGLGPWHTAQEGTLFDFCPWERLPPLGRELQVSGMQKAEV